MQKICDEKIKRIDAMIARIEKCNKIEIQGKKEDELSSHQVKEKINS